MALYSASKLVKNTISSSIIQQHAVRTLSTGTQINQKKTLTPKIGRNIVLVDGVRTPFLMSGTDYANLMPHELAKQALSGILKKTGISKDLIDYVIYGTVFKKFILQCCQRSISCCWL
ncbi:hypothetical protein JTB14_020841 [Gonioctena quinquepunctata]|nr:hypothetical protein JTB14_020841 [Gonioctena quinquepunctata]